MAVSGAVGLDNPAGLTCEGCEDIVHICTRRQRKVAVLTEAGEHPARDGSTEPFSKLRALLLPLPLPLALISGGGGGTSGAHGPGSCGGEATRSAGLRLRLLLGLERVGGMVGVVREVVGAVVALGVQILSETLIVVHVVLWLVWSLLTPDIQLHKHKNKKIKKNWNSAFQEKEKRKRKG